MEDICYYLLKSSSILTVFYMCYQFMLRQETLFKYNRFFLITGIIISITIPFIYIETAVDIPFLNWNDTTDTIVTRADLTIQNRISLYKPLLVLYIAGASVLFSRLIFQIIQLRKLLKYGTIDLKNTTVHIHTDKKIAPFSFFNYIIYNPKIHTSNDLETILAHEEVHVKQWHSLDILFTELFLVLNWFNPIAWFYRTAIKQNLEFLADSDNSKVLQNKKAYQYTLLQEVVGKHQLSIINPFFNSLIKKRIIMINKQKSKKTNAFKSLMILPLLALFLLSFNTKEVYKIENIEQSELLSDSVHFIIDKNTTDDELHKIKTNLAKEDFDFSYTIVRNDNRKIKNISLQIKGSYGTVSSSQESSSSFTATSDNDTIEPVYIIVDTKDKEISIKRSINYNLGTSQKAKIGHKISKMGPKNEPLYFIDGKKSDAKTVHNLDTDSIDYVNVLKGESAKQKYGKEAENGVVEVTLKK